MRTIVALAVAAITSTCGAKIMADQPNPVADPGAVVTQGNSRFTVLTPALIRMEWSPTGQFEDRASFAFINRRLQPPPFEVERENGSLVIRTRKLILRYTDDGEPFGTENVEVELEVGGRAVRWRPGQSNAGNLLGTTRTLDGVSGAYPLDTGLLSRDGWAVVDDSETLLFDDGDPPWAVPRPASGAVDWYFFGYGHDYTGALGDFLRVAGRIPVPPRFAFGTWWSRYWAYSADELEHLVNEFAEHDVPLDVLVIDMDWHLDGWTGYTWNPEYFPDPEGFLRWVHAQGLQTTLNLHPHDGVKSHERAFKDVVQAMGLQGREAVQVEFDCGDRDYMNAYFTHLHHPMERQGVDFWWIDWQQGEQSSIAGLDPLWWLNHMHWVDMERNPERKGKRPLILSRWGGLGNHRYQVGFSGDTYCNWRSLAFQPYFTSTAGNVGFAYWSHDIGGHQPGPVDPELYARWIQFGVLSPVLRTHTTKNPAAERRIWKFPQPFFLAAREAFHLRYALIPYIYTSARKTYDAGLPLCRPLYYHWPEIAEAYEHPGEYMFGEDLLAAPVTAPSSPISGCAEASVWLPPGRWTNWFTGKTSDGPGRVSFLVPINEIPLFVRDGGIIPAMPRMKRVDERPVDPLVLHVFPGKTGQTRVYEDDGETVDYTRGIYAWTPVSQSVVGAERRVTIGPIEGGFEGMPRKRRYEIRFRDVALPTRVTMNDLPLEETRDASRPGWHYDLKTLSAIVRLPAVKPSETTTIGMTGLDTPAGEAELGEGLRGRISRLVSVSEMLGDDAATATDEILRDLDTVAAESGVKIADAVADRWSALFELAREKALQNTRPLAQLLDLVFRSDALWAGGQGDPRLSVSVTVSASPQFLHAGRIGAQVELDPPPNWRFDGDRQLRIASLGDDRRVPMQATLVADERPDTAVLTGRLRLERHDDRDVAGSVGQELAVLPFEKILLPSVNRWWVAGPFDATWPEGMEKCFEPEREIDLKAAYSGKGGLQIGWKRVERPVSAGNDPTAEFHVEFQKVFGKLHDNAVAYALTYLRSPRAMPVILAIGSDDGVVVWLNGKEVHRNAVGRAYESRQDRVSVELAKGSNELLLKISQGGGMWGFSAHVESTDGQPVPEVVARLSP